MQPHLFLAFQLHKLDEMLYVFVLVHFLRLLRPDLREKQFFLISGFMSNNGAHVI
jgi:hypothetical protein